MRRNTRHRRIADAHRALTPVEGDSPSMANFKKYGHTTGSARPRRASKIPWIELGFLGYFSLAVFGIVWVILRRSALPDVSSETGVIVLVGPAWIDWFLTLGLWFLLFVVVPANAVIGLSMLPTRISCDPRLSEPAVGCPSFAPQQYRITQLARTL